jgi:hypothetical protein
LEWDDTGGWSHQRAKSFRHLRYLPSFHGDKDGIHDTDLSWVLCGPHRVEDKVTEYAVHPQPLGL